jgi:hypothetical protein
MTSRLGTGKWLTIFYSVPAVCTKASIGALSPCQVELLLFITSLPTGTEPADPLPFQVPRAGPTLLSNISPHFNSNLFSPD